MEWRRMNESQCAELAIELNGGSEATIDEQSGRMDVRLERGGAVLVVETEPLFDFEVERKGGMKVSYGVICTTSVGKEYVFLSSDGYILSLMNRYLAGEFEEE